MFKLSKEIFESTYQYQEETPEGMWRRVGKNLASVETNPEIWEEVFYEVLKDFKFVPGGRILSNAGTNYKQTSYINCFVSGFTGEDQDSMEGILAELRRQALILKSEGGYGFCCSTLRPRGCLIKGIGGASPGMVQFLDMWDTQSFVITKGSGTTVNTSKKKVRKGAMMVTAYCWHPDIEEFITVKQTEGKLTKFNMSVLLTDLFMKAVVEDSDWDLIFPDIEDNKPLYKKSWDGDIDKWISIGGKVDIYKTIKAKTLYDLIMKSAYNRAEPGCLFIDTINRKNNLCIVEHINATNPCGEQPLPIGGACLLGSINATQYIHENKLDWDFFKLSEDIPNIVRMLDNVIELTFMPLEDQYVEIEDKRRIGIGVTGLGSALMIMKSEYGSKESLELIENYFSAVVNMIYQASALLAKEKGPFPLWKLDNFVASGFWQGVLTNETMELISLYGLRNSHLISVQPTGNTGILANNISGGLEPVFLPEYIRTHGIDVLPDNLPHHNDWKDTKTEGDVVYKTYLLDNSLYKWTSTGGYVKESLVEDYAVHYLKSINKWDPKAPWAKTTEYLSVQAHVDVMKIISKYVDAALSKTVNLPSNYPYEDFKNLYIDAWKTGTIKGITAYREGTMSAILQKPNETKTISTKRAKTLPCDIHHLKVTGEDWLVLIGLQEEKPYEIFAFKEMEISLGKNVKKGNLVKTPKGYNLETESVTIKNIANYFGSDDEQALTRMISTLGLRQGIDIDFIINQLNQVPTSVTAFSKAITRTLAKYTIAIVVLEKCPECGGKMINEGNCLHCIDPSCGYSKC
jgi:ribonucleoside-diphosphate reductase alpha chain